MGDENRVAYWLWRAGTNRDDWSWADEDHFRIGVTNEQLVRWDQMEYTTGVVDHDQDIDEV